MLLWLIKMCLIFFAMNIYGMEHIPNLINGIESKLFQPPQPHNNQQLKTFEIDFIYLKINKIH